MHGSKTYRPYSVRRRPAPCTRARDAEELWMRIDGRLPRSETSTEEDRQLATELWARIDGSYRA